MFQAEIKHDICKNYLTVHGESKRDYMVSMLDGKHINGFLNLEVRCFNENYEYYYDITGMESVLQKSSRNKWDYSSYRRLVTQLLTTVGNSKKYMLVAEKFVLMPEYMFCSLQDETLSLCYSWNYEKSINMQLTELFAYFLNEVDYKDQSAVELAYVLYDVSREENCTLQRLWQVFSQKTGYECDDKEEIYENEQMDIEVLEEEENKAFLFGKKKEREEKNKIGFSSGKAKEKEEGNKIGFSSGKAKEKEERNRIGFSSGKMKANIEGKKISFSTDNQESSGKKKNLKFWVDKLFGNKEKQREEDNKQNMKMIEKKSKVITRPKELTEFLEKRQKEGNSKLNMKEKSSDLHADDIVVRKQASNEKIDYMNMENNYKNNVGMAAEEIVKYNESAIQPQNFMPPNYMVHTNGVGRFKESPIDLNKTTVCRKPLQLLKKMNACFLVPQNTGRDVIVVDNYPFYVGRFQKDTNQFVNDTSVSRIHCKVEEADGHYYLTDLNSTNGTYVNYSKMRKNEKYEIFEGDNIIVADVEFTFTLRQDALALVG
ncbi:MAG: FHA domain-containing protein [Lachnospiraceae bacterium]|nr:FHA domain-containing protein [Lachnospiraceae bacterium]